MKHLNIEIKARTSDSGLIKEILRSRNAYFKGLDHQIDTYFNVNQGRLKIREGNIENHLVYYNRRNQEGPKQSDVTLFDFDSDSSLKEILTNSLGILTVVDKKREIYFIDNVKFHIDEVKNLGNFVEIEAINDKGFFSKEKLLEQCNYYLDLFKISDSDLISCSYSDLLIRNIK